MSIIKKLVLVCVTIFAIAGFLLYLKLFWYFPRSRRYEAKLTHALTNLKANGDTLATFRLDSIMDFEWHRVIHVGPYLDVPNETRKCGIDLSVLRNAPLSHYDHYRSLLFLDEQNNPIKYLQFDNMILGFEFLNKKFTCGAKKEEAVFRLRSQKRENEDYYILRWAL